MQKPEAILIPGGGLTENGQLPSWTRARLELALSRYRKGLILITLSGGTVHKPPPLDEEGYPLFESRIAAEYLMDQGIPPDKIWAEISSYDTIGNAFFSRFLHVQPARLERILVITSAFHMARTKSAFRWIFNLSPLPIPFQLGFDAAPDRGLDQKSLQARKEKEARSLRKLQETKAGIHTVKSFHHWFYTQHEAYASGSHPHRLSGDITATY